MARARFAPVIGSPASNNQKRLSRYSSSAAVARVAAGYARASGIEAIVQLRSSASDVALPLKPPLAPQLARSAKELPVGEQWCYEPKYDGFRAIAFVDDEQLTLQSRAGKPLGRYFPELSFPPGRYVLDGEIVIDSDEGGQDFGALSQRIHPAESRIERLAAETPARYIAFDLLAQDERSLLEQPLSQRRAALQELIDGSEVAITPSTSEAGEAAPWLRSGEGVVAKDVHAPYRPGQRTGMFKIKRLRTIDAVVAGYRPGKEPDTVGSLILGLYDTRRRTARRGPLLGPARRGEARAGRQTEAIRDRQARPR